MLKTKVIERNKPSNKILELFSSTNLNYTFNNGYTQVIERTNIKQVFPIVYKINNLTIYEFPKDKLKTSKLNKYLFIDFINQVDNPNKEYDILQGLSITLTNVDEQFKEKNKTIKTLTKNNKAITLRVKTLNNYLKDKDNEISFLKSKINSKKNTIKYWKDKLISFLHSKLHNWYDEDDKYINVVNDMYNDDVLDDDDIKDLKLNKQKGDYEL